MKRGEPLSVIWVQWLPCVCWLSLLVAPDWADSFATLPADRAAIKRVYYNHRLDEKPPFEQVLPPATLDNLVRLDLRKEAAIKSTYGVEVTPAMLDAEVRRINTTTRAPEMLAEIKAALGNDPVRFSRAMSRPILIKRLLRERFDNDDTFHAGQRREMERIRTELTNAAAALRRSQPNEAQTSSSQLSALNPQPESQRLAASAATRDLVAKLLALLKRVHSNDVAETTWQLGARPDEPPGTPTANELEIKQRFGPTAQIISSPRAGDGRERRLYFDDLHPDCRPLILVTSGFVLFLHSTL